MIILLFLKMSDVSLSVSLCSRNSTFDSSSWQQRELSLTFEKTSEMSLILLFFQVDWNQRSWPISNRKHEPLRANRKNRQDSSLPTVRLSGTGLFDTFGKTGGCLSHVLLYYSVLQSSSLIWMLKKKYWNYFQIAISESDPTEWHEFYD